jgi:hypothetical protein
MIRIFTHIRGLLVGISVILSGCGDSNGGLLAISGKITVNGEPLKDGQIIFEPLDKGNGSSSGAPIKDGAYDIKRVNGLKPGKYLVRITCGDGKTPPNVHEAGAPGGSTNIVSFDLIPPEFGVKSTQEVEVKNGGSNHFDFAIPKFMTAPTKKKI